MMTGSIVTDVTVLTEEQEPLHLLTVEDYDQMMASGVIHFRDPIELLDGVIVQMTPESDRHSIAAGLVARWLIRSIDDERLLVRLAAPLTLPPLSQPEPDLAVTELADSIGAHPQRAHLVVEVSLSSLRKDRGRKARIYAEAGIPRYWIVDLVHESVTVHLDPSDLGYRSITTFTPPDVVDPGLFDIPPLDLEALFKHL